jgi:hypothetical protein
MRSRGKLFALVTSIVLSGAVVVSAFGTPVNAAPKRLHQKWQTGGVKPGRFGMLDCNGLSPIQRPIKVSAVCSDPKGYEGSRFYENGHYIGHDEPIVRFTSDRPGSGNHSVWRERLPLDPHRRPTVHSPGNDVTHYFELTIAPWFSMGLCNGRSYPLNPCTPNSDSNAPSATSLGGGSSFLEMQFYPPGFGPFPDNISCDNTHWCASLHINDLECDAEGNCNFNCIEPTNFAFIQTDGVPTGPPSPQLSNLDSVTPNSHTLLMNPGDRIVAKIFDADIGGGKHALETRIDDLTTGKSGYMIASAKNGFMATNIGDCSGVPFNYQPEYKTASQDNVIPWAALQTNISTQFEIGHFIPCSKVTDPALIDLGGGVLDTTWQTCKGPYEEAGEHSSLPEEPTDAFCFPEGFRHHGLAPPNLVTGCTNILSGGDTNFDGTSYWPNWPNHLEAHRYPQPFLQRQPKTADNRPYEHFQFQTDAPASEATCTPTGDGCAVPPPGAPGNFYPYWTLAQVHHKCVWEFGQMTNGKTYGKAKQYGEPALDWFFGNLEGPIRPLPNC